MARQTVMVALRKMSCLLLGLNEEQFVPFFLENGTYWYKLYAYMLLLFPSFSWLDFEDYSSSTRKLTSITLITKCTGLKLTMNKWPSFLGLSSSCNRVLGFFLIRINFGEWNSLWKEPHSQLFGERFATSLLSVVHMIDWIINNYSSSPNGLWVISITQIVD